MISFLCIYFLIHYIPIFSCYSFDECGISYNQVIAPHVVGGHRSAPLRWPWVVAIYAKGEKICTGSIISRNFVLTAAHCYTTQTKNSNDEMVKFSIYAGSILANDGQGMNIGVEYEEIYDEFYDIEFVKNDIALLKLEKPLPFNQNISKICLPKSYREMEEKIAFMAGFGGTSVKSDGYERNNKLYETTVSFQDFNHCQMYNQRWNFTSQNYICSGAYMSGSAHGDSGGPLMVQGSNRDPRWFEVGAIVSSVYPRGYSHSNIKGVVSTRISFYCDWIEEKTDGDVKCIDIDDNNNIFTKTPLPTPQVPLTCANVKCSDRFTCSIVNNEPKCTNDDHPQTCETTVCGNEYICKMEDSKPKCVPLPLPVHGERPKNTSRQICLKQDSDSLCKKGPFGRCSSGLMCDMTHNPPICCPLFLTPRISYGPCIAHGTCPFGSYCMVSNGTCYALLKDPCKGKLQGTFVGYADGGRCAGTAVLGGNNMCICPKLRGSQLGQLSIYGSGSRSGSGYVLGSRSGYGSGSRSGSRSRSRYGSGYRYGLGSGSKSRYGSGYGLGSGSRSRYGSGYRYGLGSGSGYVLPKGEYVYRTNYTGITNKKRPASVFEPYNIRVGK